ncbi:MAG: hypothetical protein J6K88_04510 [Oscillospiraceae bacterium]|nr:hypothetical protein [Oscillospiraceae bacterium]
MKKTIAFLISISLLFSTFSVFAAEKTTENNTYGKKIINEEIEYYPDGSYTVITLTEDEGITPRGTVYSKSGSKKFSHYDSNKLAWEFTVHGTFTVTTGVHAMCIASSYSVNISNNAWSNKSASTYEHSNQAVGNATFTKKILFVTTDTEDCQVILYCDANGQLS